MISVKEKFPFNLKTQEQKNKWIKQRKWFFFGSIFFLIFGIILVFIPNLEYLGGILVVIGYISLTLFLFVFWIENLIVMWRVKRRTYFWFSVFIGIVHIIFYFSEFYPYLKGEATINELRGKEEKIELNEEDKRRLKEAEKKDNKDFIKFLKWMGIAIGVIILFLVIQKIFF